MEDYYLSLRYSRPQASKESYNATKSSLVFRIPKFCYQTWVTNRPNEISAPLRQLLEWNKKLNPDITFQLWNDTEIDIFIRNEFPGEIYAAFQAINPVLGAAKADFFRYCIIYKRGGIYLDLKSSIKIPGVFGNVIRPGDECLLDIRREEKEPYRGQWRYGSYEQWFLAYAPGHPYLKYMIDRMTRSIHARITPSLGSKKEMKQAVLRLTGPDGSFHNIIKILPAPIACNAINNTFYGLTAYAAAIHDAIVDLGPRHRELSYFSWLRYRALDRSIYSDSPGSRHYTDLKGEALYTAEHLQAAVRR